MWKGKWPEFLLKMVVLTSVMLLAFHPGTTNVMASVAGGISDPRTDGSDPTHDLEIIELAKYAVEQFCKQSPTAHIKFSRVISARTQVVAGIMHYLVIEVINNKEQTEEFEAMIWVKPWNNFKQIVEFKQI